jgi:hypothetical protein
MKLPRKPRRAFLTLEPLECRTVPAADITVTTLADVVDSEDGVISLREAIDMAESDPDPTTIDFDPSIAGGTINLTDFSAGNAGEGETSDGPSAFVITTPIRIIGTGEHIQRSSQAANFRLFDVTNSGRLSLENLELSQGIARGGDGFSGGGGAAGLGGAIFNNQGTVIIRNSTFDNNVALGGSGAVLTEGVGGGGGLAENANGQNGGGPNGGNGEVFNGGFGGGGYATFGESASGNGGFGGGGGAGSLGGSAGKGGFGGGGGGSFDTTFGAGGFGGSDGTSGNTTTGGGGGGAGMGGAIFNLGGQITVVNSTFAYNTALGGTDSVGGGRGGSLGGGIFNLNGDITVINSTFASNSADTGGSIYNLSHDGTEGVPFQRVASAFLANSIFEDSSSASQRGIEQLNPSADEVHNEFVVNSQTTSGSFLASIDASAPNITNHGGFVNVNGDMQTDGLITDSGSVVTAGLAGNGGLTPTVAIAFNSAAANKGDNNLADDPSAESSLVNDQRGPGFPRIIGGNVDLGAYEAAVPTGRGPTTVVTTGEQFVIITKGEEKTQFNNPFPFFTGTIRVALGDVNNDGTPDYIFTVGVRGGPHVEVFDGANGNLLYSFFAYQEDFRGGVFVASGDLNGDGYDDIVTGAGMGGGPHVRAFSGKDGSVLADFFAYDPNFRGGVTVALGDVNGDGTLDIITGPGPGGGDAVLIIDGTKLDHRDEHARILPDAILQTLHPYGESFQDGVEVAAGLLDGDNKADVVAGPLTRGNLSQTFVFAGAPLTQVSSFFAEDLSLSVGLRFAIADVDGDRVEDLIVVAAPGGGPRQIVVDPLTGHIKSSTFFADDALRTGFEVGAIDGPDLAPPPQEP